MYTDPAAQAAAMLEVAANRRKAEAIISAEARRMGWRGLWELAQAIEAQAVKLPRKPRQVKQQAPDAQAPKW